MKLAAIGVLVITALLEAASFEVATIKPAVPDASGSSGEDGRNGMLRMWNVSLKRCIRYAYGIPEEEILGGPDWVDSISYDILAKADHAAGEPELLTMLQPLMADRFKLVFHRESRMVPGYFLVPAKGGIKAQVADPNRHSGGNGGRGFIDAVASPLAALTIRLTALLERPVVDRTGDQRMFDIHLRWTPDDAQTGGEAPPADRPSLFTALQEQLGLRLESVRVPVDVIVVDHAELPSDN